MTEPAKVINDVNFPAGQYLVEAVRTSENGAMLSMSVERQKLIDYFCHRNLGGEEQDLFLRILFAVKPASAGPNWTPANLRDNESIYVWDIGVAGAAETDGGSAANNEQIVRLRTVQEKQSKGNIGIAIVTSQCAGFHDVFGQGADQRETLLFPPANWYIMYADRLTGHTLDQAQVDALMRAVNPDAPGPKAPVAALGEPTTAGGAGDEDAVELQLRAQKEENRLLHARLTSLEARLSNGDRGDFDTRSEGQASHAAEPDRLRNLNDLLNRFSDHDFFSWLQQPGNYLFSAPRLRFVMHRMNDSARIIVDFMELTDTHMKKKLPNLRITFEDIMRLLIFIQPNTNERDFCEILAMGQSQLRSLLNAMNAVKHGDKVTKLAPHFATGDAGMNKEVALLATPFSKTRDNPKGGKGDKNGKGGKGDKPGKPGKGAKPGNAEGDGSN